MIPGLGLPGACTAVGLLVQNAATQCHGMAQALLRPDIDTEAQRSTTLAALKLARESIAELEKMIQVEPAKRKGSKR